MRIRRTLVPPSTHEAFSDPTTRHRVEGRPDSRVFEAQHSFHGRLAQTNVMLASLEQQHTFFWIDLEKFAEASPEIDRLAPEMLEGEHIDVLAPQGFDKDPDRSRKVEVIREFVARNDRSQPLLGRRRTKKTEAPALQPQMASLQSLEIECLYKIDWPANSDDDSAASENVAKVPRNRLPNSQPGDRQPFEREDDLLVGCGRREDLLTIEPLCLIDVDGSNVILDELVSEAKRDFAAAASQQGIRPMPGSLAQKYDLGVICEQTTLKRRGCGFRESDMNTNASRHSDGPARRHSQAPSTISPRSRRMRRCS